MTVYDSHNVSISLEDIPFARGGEGEVYRILSPNGLKDFCAKIYKKSNSEKRDKICHMLGNPPVKTKDSNFIICWPTELIYNKKREFIGFIMPLAVSGSESLFNLCLPQIDKKLSDEWEKKFDWSTSDGMENRAKICVNIAIAIYNLHCTKKYSIVDYKPQNILITHQGLISILDIDSIQISENDKVLYHAEVCTPEYAPMEANRINPSKEYVAETWDRFSIAVNFYEILFGIHPFSATAGRGFENQTNIQQKIQSGLFVHGSKRSCLEFIPTPHNYFNNLPENLKNLFLVAFEEGSVNPIKRPAVQDWGRSIVTAINSKQIKANKFVIKPEPVIKITGQRQPIPHQQSAPQQPIPKKPAPQQPVQEKSNKSLSIIIWIFVIIVILYITLRIFNKFNAK